jgi:hypothetical protein
MRRAGVIAVLGALLSMFGAVVTASPALARGPQWTYLNFGKHFTEPAALCGFKINGTQPVDKVYLKTLKTTDGSTEVLITGSAEIALTNPANGKTITQNVSGPGKIIFNADGSTVVLGKGIGPWGLAPADQARFGLPGLFIFAGAATATIAPDGITTTSLTLHGHILVNVCAVLS